MTKKKAPQDLKKRGVKPMYGEETVAVTMKVPKSKKEDYKRMAKRWLKKWEVKPAKKTTPKKK